MLVTDLGHTAALEGVLRKQQLAASGLGAIATPLSSPNSSSAERFDALRYPDSSTILSPAWNTGDPQLGQNGFAPMLMMETSPTVSLRNPWDMPEDPDLVSNHAPPGFAFYDGTDNGPFSRRPSLGASASVTPPMMPLDSSFNVLEEVEIDALDQADL